MCNEPNFFLFNILIYDKKIWSSFIINFQKNELVSLSFFAFRQFNKKQIQNLGIYSIFIKKTLLELYEFPYKEMACKNDY